jgi:hypothetical protein
MDGDEWAMNVATSENPIKPKFAEYAFHALR